MAITNHERVGKTLERLNTPKCCRRSMMEWIDQARMCLAENLPNGSRMIVLGRKREAMRCRTATWTCW